MHRGAVTLTAILSLLSCTNSKPGDPLVHRPPPYTMQLTPAEPSFSEPLSPSLEDAVADIGQALSSAAVKTTRSDLLHSDPGQSKVTAITSSYEGRFKVTVSGTRIRNGYEHGKLTATAEHPTMRIDMVLTYSDGPAWVYGSPELRVTQNGTTEIVPIRKGTDGWEASASLSVTAYLAAVNALEQRIDEQAARTTYRFMQPGKGKFSIARR